MGLSTTLLPHIPLSFHRHYFKCSHRIHESHRTLSFLTSTSCCALHGINSILGDRKSSVDYGTPEPARALLERLFVQTQKLEEHMNGNSNYYEDAESNVNLEILESDLEAALEALRKEEVDLKEAERMVMLEHAELKQIREELECREKEIATACSKQEKLEDELRQANLKLISQARHIEDLKLQLKELDHESVAAESALLVKEDEMDKMRSELTRKNEKASKTEAELVVKAQLLDEANNIVKKQDIELRELRNALSAKWQEVVELSSIQQLEAEKLKVAETKLEKQTLEWLLAQEELKNLEKEASKHVGESKETMEDFRRVKKLLVDVRSGLISSQNSFVNSQQKMEEQEMMLEKQLMDLEEKKKTIMSYIDSLKSAQIEVESERARLRVSEALNNELELDLSLKRDQLQDLQEDLDKQKHSLQQTLNKSSSLQQELQKKRSEFEEASNTLEVKEKELIEAKFEIQHLMSEQKSLRLILQERDLEFVASKKRLEEVNAKVAKLKILLNRKEDQLILATDMLKEKDENAEAMWYEQDDAKLEASEAESVVERIVDLTKELVVSTKDDNLYTPNELDTFSLQLLKKPVEDYMRQKKQLEAELELAKENLMEKEMELLSAQRQLAIKDKELEIVLQRSEEKDRELKELKKARLTDVDGLKKLSSIARDSVGQKSVDDLAVEKLQLEGAQLEVEAATSALHKLAEMSRELLTKAILSINADLDVNAFPQNGDNHNPKACTADENVSLQKDSYCEPNSVKDKECLTQIESEVARLSALTERLVHEAAVSSATE